MAKVSQEAYLDTLSGMEIAVIGMAAKFPGADNITEFWENLQNGVESIKFFSQEELRKQGVSEEQINNPDYVPARGVIREYEHFDAAFFGYSAEEAELMDPQTRLLHECAWHALEDGAYDFNDARQVTALYCGASISYGWQMLAALEAQASPARFFEAEKLFQRDYLPSRISFKLNLSGPSLSLFSACSTSLLAIHTACQSLLSGECDLALAGGACLVPEQLQGYLFQEGMIQSAKGHVRAFDRDADGTVGGSGAGIVLLKLLEEAVRDGNKIYAVIKGSAVNNDGNQKVGFSAPGIEGQARVIRAAHDAAGVQPESISYLEAHGTGTKLGDPVEVEALTTAFNTSRKQFCALGSVKSNIGHLDTAAGIAGFIKTVLALSHKKIPASLNFENPNPHIDFENSPFYVNTRLKKWPSDERACRAGVSSFGIGGTNVHVVVEEAPEFTQTALSLPRTFQLLSLSAKTTETLQNQTDNIIRFMEENSQIPAAHICYNLHRTRKYFQYRLGVAGKDTKDLIAQLTALSLKKISITAEEEPAIFFMFPGQGAQYPMMARELYQQESGFKERLDTCFQYLARFSHHEFTNILLAQTSKNQEIQITQTEIAQPLLFSIEYALAGLLIHWGIQPENMIGHSLGEYVCAALAEVFSLEDALKIVCQRGRLMQAQASGCMLAVSVSEEEIAKILPNTLSLAALNSSQSVVVSGPDSSIQDFEQILQKQKIAFRPLHTSHAFHSSMMDPLKAEFEQFMEGITFHKPKIPFISSFTGRQIDPAEVNKPRYWSEQLRYPVRFAAGLSQLLQEENGIFLEVGPGSALSTFARQNPARKTNHTILNVMPHAKESLEESRYLCKQLGSLWCNGVNVNWKRFYEGQSIPKIRLPGYPFARKRYWKLIDSYLNRNQELFPSGKKDKRQKLSDWLYVPSWKRSLQPEPIDEGESDFPMLIFHDEHEIARELMNRVTQSSDSDSISVISVVPGESFQRKDHSSFCLRPDKEEDYHKLLNCLEEDGVHCRNIAHLWGITTFRSRSLDMTEYNKAAKSGYNSLLCLSRSLSDCFPDDYFSITVLVSQLFQVGSAESIDPFKALVLGPVLVIPREFSYRL